MIRVKAQDGIFLNKSGKASLIHYLSSPAEASLRSRPINASIGDGDTIIELIEGTREGLVACVEMTFDHYPMNAIRTVFDLLHDFIQNQRLPGGVFSTVGMTAVDHNGYGCLCRFQGNLGNFDFFGGLVGPIATTPQDQLTIGISTGGHCRGLAVFGNS